MTNTSRARKIISSKYYYANRMERMDRECAYYIEQMYAAKNGILRKAFAKMSSIYLKRYAYYLQKCTTNELGKSLQN